MKYTFQSGSQLVKSTDESYAGFNVSVKDAKGQAIEHLGKSKFYVSLALVKAGLTGRGINADALTDREITKCLDTSTLDCTLLFKKEGEDFEATEFSRIYDADSGEFIKAQAGELYQVQEDGIDIDYRKESTLIFDEDFLDILDARVLARAVKEVATVSSTKVEEVVILEE